MAKRLLRLVLVLVIAFLLAQSLRLDQVYAQQGVFVPANDVLFTISCDRPTYKLGEQLRVYYSVKNISRGALYVPRTEWELTCPPNPHVRAWFEDPTGQHFTPGYAGDCSRVDMSVTERMTKEAVLLKPGEVFRDHFALDTKTFLKELRPGSYRIEAALSGWRPNDFDPKARGELEAMKHPFLYGESSASVTVVIKD